MTLTLIALLVLYQLKHFVADYPLQNSYMLGKFKSGKDWILPLIAHSGVHAGFTFLIAYLFSFSFLLAIGLAAFDFAIHFLMDRIKAGPKYLGRFKALAASEYAASSDEQKKGNKYFWWALGFDQMVHHLTHYAIIAMILWAI